MYLGASFVSMVLGAARTRYNTDLSLYHPYTSGAARLENWDVVGDTHAVSKGRKPGVYLTIHRGDSFGMVAGKSQMRMKEWRVDVHYGTNDGSSGIGIWITQEKIAPAQNGLFGGGSETKNGRLVFLALGENPLVSSFPSIGLLDGGKAPQINTIPEGPLERDGVIRVEYSSRVLNVYLGPTVRSMKLMITSQMQIPRGSFLAITGSNRLRGGEVLIKEITTSVISSSPKFGKYVDVEEGSRSRRSFVSLVFICIIVGVGVYIIRNRQAPKRTRNLKY